MVSAFEGNKAETKTMLLVIEVFMAVHDLPQARIRCLGRSEGVGRGASPAESLRRGRGESGEVGRQWLL